MTVKTDWIISILAGLLGFLIGFILGMVFDNTSILVVVLVFAFIIVNRIMGKKDAGANRK